MFKILYIQILCCVMESNLRLPLEMRSFAMYHAWILKEGKSTVKYWYKYMRGGSSLPKYHLQSVQVCRLDYFRLDWVSMIY